MEYYRFERLKLPDVKLEPIIRAGTHANFIYFLLEGTVDVTSVDGTRHYVTLNPGSVFGDISALYNIPSTYNY